MTNPQKFVELYTDGSCLSNPGHGGWGAILRYRGHEKELCGGEPDTTNNRMELTAAIEGLSALKEPCRVTLYSDSQYLVNGMQKGWAKKWKANGWMRNKKEPAVNPDLWDKLLSLFEYHQVTLVWVKGHAGHPENERCDQLAVSQSKRIQAQKN